MMSSTLMKKGLNKTSGITIRARSTKQNCKENQMPTLSATTMGNVAGMKTTHLTRSNGRKTLNLCESSRPGERKTGTTAKISSLPTTEPTRSKSRHLQTSDPINMTNATLLSMLTGSTTKMGSLFSSSKRKKRTTGRNPSNLTSLPGWNNKKTRKSTKHSMSRKRET